MKFIWGYILFAITIREIFILVFNYIDFALPLLTEYKEIISRDGANVLSFLYTIFITTIPIFLMSFQADLQLKL
jgi:hypothetical protein